jgi:hypothetical protein
VLYRSQIVAYTTTYAALALCFAVALLVNLRNTRRTLSDVRALGVHALAPSEEYLAALDEADGSGGERGGAASPTASRAHVAEWESTQLRLGLLFACALLRCIAQALMGLELLAVEDKGLLGTVAQLLEIVVVLEDGQGLITFLLFGLPPLT